MTRPRSKPSSAQRLRRLVVGELVAGPLLLDRRQAHYVRDVLRLTVGAELELVDRQGARAGGVLSQVGSEVSVEVFDVSVGQTAAIWLTVAVSLPKGERADWVVEKLTELGVGSIVWLTCARSVAEASVGSARYARWQRLIDAAAAQSGIGAVPQLLGTTSLPELVDVPADWRLLADPKGLPLVAQRPKRTAARVVLAVGPEGGFTGAEQAQAEEAGFARVSLAEPILRVETAAVVGAAMALATAGCSTGRA